MADSVIACGPTVCFTLKSNAAESKACEEEGHIKDGRVDDIDSLSTFIYDVDSDSLSQPCLHFLWLSRVSEISILTW